MNALCTKQRSRDYQCEELTRTERQREAARSSEKQREAARSSKKQREAARSSETCPQQTSSTATNTPSHSVYTPPTICLSLQTLLLKFYKRYMCKYTIHTSQGPHVKETKQFTPKSFQSFWQNNVYNVHDFIVVRPSSASHFISCKLWRQATK